MFLNFEKDETFPSDEGSIFPIHFLIPHYRYENKDIITLQSTRMRHNHC